MAVFVSYPAVVLEPTILLPRAVVNALLAQRLVTLQLIYSVGLALGLVCMLLGVVLLLHGVAGSTGWVVQLLGLKSSLSDAAPGTALFVVGLLIVFVTRFSVRILPEPGQRPPVRRGRQGHHRDETSEDEERNS